MKFMNLKRFGSVALAGAVVMAMSAPAFAADPPANTTTISGAYNAIDLRVVVPATGNAIINPYGLPYQMGDATISGQQITTGAPLVLQNKSTVPLAVTANLSGTGSTGVTLEAASATTDYTTSTDKKLHVVFEAFTADSLTALNVTDTDTLRPLFAALDSDDAVLTGDVTGTAANATGSLVLREGADGEVQSGGAALYRLSGEVSKKAAWTSADTFTATIAFTFEPSEYTKNAGTLELSRPITMNVSGSTTADISFTSALPTGVTATSTTYTSSDETVMKIQDGGTGSSGKQAKAISAGTAVLTVTIEGSDHLTYKSTLSVTVGS